MCQVNDTVWASLDDGLHFNHKLLLDTRGGYNTVQITATSKIAVVYEASPPQETGCVRACVRACSRLHGMAWPGLARLTAWESTRLAVLYARTCC